MLSSFSFFRFKAPCGNCLIYCITTLFILTDASEMQCIVLLFRFWTQVSYLPIGRGKEAGLNLAISGFLKKWANAHTDTSPPSYSMNVK